MWLLSDSSCTLLKVWSRLSLSSSTCILKLHSFGTWHRTVLIFTLQISAAPGKLLISNLSSGLNVSVRFSVGFGSKFGEISRLALCLMSFIWLSKYEFSHLQTTSSTFGWNVHFDLSTLSWFFLKFRTRMLLPDYCRFIPFLLPIHTFFEKFLNVFWTAFFPNSVEGIRARVSHIGFSKQVF